MIKFAWKLWALTQIIGFILLVIFLEILIVKGVK